MPTKSNWHYPVQLVHQDAKKFFSAAVRSDCSRHADKCFVPHIKPRRWEDFQVAVHGGVPPELRKVPCDLMLGGGKLIRVPKSGKEVFVVTISRFTS